MLKNVPLFALLDDEETTVLASQVELKTFVSRERIYKIGDPGGQAYVIISGRVRVTTVDEDHQEVVVDEPAKGEFFGFASMLEQTPHQTNAIALEETTCLKVSRDDVAVLLQRKSLAGMDLLTTLGRQFHASQELVRVRANRNPNEVIEKEATLSERIADSVARFGGSWALIISFAILLTAYTVVNVVLHKRAWDPYPFILLKRLVFDAGEMSAHVMTQRSHHAHGTAMIGFVGDEKFVGGVFRFLSTTQAVAASGPSASGDEYNVIFAFPFGMLDGFKVVHESLISA